MIVNFPDDAACTICFSMELLILLDNCYSHLPCERAAHSDREGAGLAFFCAFSCTLALLFGAISSLPLRIVPDFLRPPEAALVLRPLVVPCAMVYQVGREGRGGCRCESGRWLS